MNGEKLRISVFFSFTPAEITILFIMTTAIVEIKNNIALDLLRYLENIGMLRLLKNLPTATELPKPGLAKARGGLHKYANPDLIQL